jgi:hypothetical protein
MYGWMWCNWYGIPIYEKKNVGNLSLQQSLAIMHNKGFENGGSNVRNFMNVCSEGKIECQTNSFIKKKKNVKRIGKGKIAAIV